MSGYYRKRVGGCTCNDHCSWDLCRTFEPPTDCLFGTNSDWKWDRPQNAWVAHIIEGNYAFKGITIWYSNNMKLVMKII